MLTERFNLQRTLKEMFSPLAKHPIWMLCLSAVITVVSYGLVNAALAGLVSQNTEDINLLSTELLFEVGPDYDGPDGAGKEQMEFIATYKNHLERKPFAAILQLLYPDYSFSKALAKVQEELNIEVKGKKAKAGIYRAGLRSHQLYKTGKEFSRSPILTAWFKPKGSALKLDNELDAFNGLVDKFVDTQTMEAAWPKCRQVCIDSRKNFLKLYLGRLNYNKEKATRFLKDLERARDFAQSCSQKEGYEEKWQKFSDRARNIGIRARALTLMLADDMEALCAFLNQEKEKLIAEKEREEALMAKT